MVAGGGAVPGSVSELLDALSKYPVLNHLALIYAVSALAGPTLLRSARRALFAGIDLYFDVKVHIRRRRREIETAGAS